MPRMPIIEELAKEPIPPGSNILVEFDPASQWFNASLTIAAGWVKDGGSVSYIAQSQSPDDILDRFNDEKNWVELYLTRPIPMAKSREITQLMGFMGGVHSNWAYKQLEAAMDGIVDFKVEEAHEPARDLVRMRSMRKARFDRKWHGLSVGENCEISLMK